MTEDINNQALPIEDQEYLPLPSGEFEKNQVDGYDVVDENELIEDGLIEDSNKPKTFRPMNNSKGYVTPVQARVMMDFYKAEAKKHPVDYTLNRLNQFRVNIIKGLMIFTLWYSGRRVSEIVGQPPFDRCHGLRPCDFNFQENLIIFSILKKNSVKKERKGKKRTEEAIKRDYAHKEIHLEQKPLPKIYMTVMKYWIDKFKISPHERIFPHTRRYVQYLVEHAANENNLKLPGKRFWRVKDSPTQRMIKPAMISPHSFRHGYAIHFLNANANNPKALPILQLLLSHNDINTTKEYLRFQIGDMTELVENMTEWKIGETK